MDGSSGGSFLPAERSALGDVVPHGFFAPVSRKSVHDLIEACAKDAQQIQAVAQLAGEFFKDTLRHFVAGNMPEERVSLPKRVEAVFEPEGAMKSLNAEYWQKALDLTDCYEMMPTKRRNEWTNSIRDLKTPEFTEETVVPTLRELLSSRELFFSERVDGIFRGLSGEHVTNRPEGFRKRMIIGYMASEGFSWNGRLHMRHEKTGLVHDLRAIIARFQGVAPPSYQRNHHLMEMLSEATGEWHIVDGGALRVRLYKKGTAHLEVHPDVAYKLNMALSVLYPMAIPSEFRAPSKRQAKTFSVLQTPVPGPVLDLLCADTRRMGETTYCIAVDLWRAPKCRVALEQAVALIESLGGTGDGKGNFEFEYNYREVFSQVITTGCVPEKKSTQFYATPAALAERAVAVAEIGPTDRCLEPSAGNGALASLMPLHRTHCVELTALRCRILKSRGYQVDEADFIGWAESHRRAGSRYDRVVMNPPFADGRAKAHLEAALGLLAPGGRLVAILPEGMRSTRAPAGFRFEFSEQIDNAFPDASVRVVLLTADRVGA